jgi:hypothetical protein
VVVVRVLLLLLVLVSTPVLAEGYLDGVNLKTGEQMSPQEWNKAMAESFVGHPIPDPQLRGPMTLTPGTRNLIFTTYEANSVRSIPDGVATLGFTTKSYSNEVVDINLNSSLLREGLKVGDYILEIDGKSLRGEAFKNACMGKPGTSVELKISHIDYKGNIEHRIVTAERRRFN